MFGLVGLVHLGVKLGTSTLHRFADPWYAQLTLNAFLYRLTLSPKLPCVSFSTAFS